LRGGSSVLAQTTAGAKVTVPVIVDMSNAGGANFASITLGVAFSTSRLTFDSVKATGFGTLASNTNAAGSGSLSLSVFDPVGTTSTVTIANLYFTATGGVGGSRVQFSPTVAGDASGNSIINLFRLQHL